MLTVSAVGGDPVRGALLLAVYALGMAVPLFLLALAWDRFELGRRRWLRGRAVRLGPLTVHSTSAAGGLLFVLTGVAFLVFDGMASLGSVVDLETEYAWEERLAEVGALVSDRYLAILVGATLAAGGCWVMQETFEPGAALALMERERVTEPYTLPHQTGALAEHPSWSTTDLSSLRCVYGKGASARHPTVTGDPEGLVAALAAAVAGGADVVVADATTEDHLERIATAAAAVAEQQDLLWVTSDPGPASAALARALGLQQRTQSSPLLVVSGSATELTRSQLRQLSSRTGTVIHPTPEQFFEVPIAGLPPEVLSFIR